MEAENDKYKAMRKSYSVEYQKMIVEENRGKNLTVFCQEKLLNLRMVRRWRTQYEKFNKKMEEGFGKQRKCGSGQHPFHTDLEEISLNWIIDMRTRSEVVRRADIQAFALEAAISLEISQKEFKASRHWLDNFLQRNELSLRRSTTLFKLEDQEIVKRAIQYKNFIDKLDFSKYKLCNMIAMDETAVYMGQSNQTTIDFKGASSIYIPSTGYESARVTCILAVRLDGRKVAPFVISKGKKESVESASKVYIIESERAWSTQAVIRKWVDMMLPRVLRGNQRGLIIWDSASTHRAKEMKMFLAERGIDQVMIPAGMTAYLQSLDIAINKPFKDNIRLEINDYIKNRMTKNKNNNFVKPCIQEVVSWVRNSWDKLSDDCVLNALKAGYLDKKTPFEESYIAKHERLGPLIMKQLETNELKSEIEEKDLELYDDIAEDDDMTVYE